MVEEKEIFSVEKNGPFLFSFVKICFATLGNSSPKRSDDVV